MNNKTQTMTSWLLGRPLKWALVAFAAMLAVGILYGFVGGAMLGVQNASTGLSANLGIFAEFITLGIVAGIYLWRLPRTDMDQRAFIALNTPMMVITGAAICLSAGLAFLIPALIRLTERSAVSAGLTLLLIGGVYMYILMVAITSLYVKYRRARAMGVAPWAAILSMPFGFAMFWLAGYMLPDQDPAKPQIAPRTTRYGRLVDKIMSRPMYVMLTLLGILVLNMTGTLGDWMLGVCLILMAAFWNVRGTDAMRGLIPRAYARTAVVANFIMIAAALAPMAMHPTPAPQSDITIYDVAAPAEPTPPQE